MKYEKIMGEIRMKLRYIVDMDIDESDIEMEFKLANDIKDFVKDHEYGYIANSVNVKLQDEYCMKEEQKILKTGKAFLDKNNVYIIETNYDIDGNDFQSRIISCSSWEQYISFYKDYNGKATENIYGSLVGYVLPYHAKIENFKYDEYTLSCDLRLFNNCIKKRFATKIDNLQEFLKRSCK